MKNKNKVNIVIPSITISTELIKCLREINSQNYKKFFVTIVLDKMGGKKVPKVNYKINILIVGKKNMSYKRNFAVKKFRTNYIAFIDSDTYPHKNWLKIAIKLLATKKYDVVGGPNIPFPKQGNIEKICHYAKRSFFVTGYLNFRKYKAKSRYCDWLESCNFLMFRNNYLKYKGMNASIYLGEDKEFFERINKQNQNFKTFYTPKLYIYHKERSIKKFLTQRMAFGTDFLNIIDFNKGLKGLLPALPIVIFIVHLFFLIYFFKLTIKFILLSVILIQLFIYLNIRKYIKLIKTKILTIIIINFANIFFALGGIIKILGLKKLVDRRLYLKSRDNK